MRYGYTVGQERGLNSPYQQERELHTHQQPQKRAVYDVLSDAPRAACPRHGSTTSPEKWAESCWHWVCYECGWTGGDFETVPRIPEAMKDPISAQQKMAARALRDAIIRIGGTP